MRTRTKICGLTQVNDALVAAQAGADAVGLVFYAPSPRAVSIEKAREIVDALPPFVTAVGLFVDAQPAEVERVLEAVPLGLLQFHGSESPQQCERYEMPYIKALRMAEGVDVLATMVTYHRAQGLLLDAYDPQVAGGTGKTFDWSRIPPRLAKPLILAGGLTAETVAAAVRQVRPYAVDVSGGVEAAKGVKDHKKIQEFIESVRRADE